MNQKRLQALATMLETDPAVRGGFNMGAWMNKCGTVGCAFGWYCSNAKGSKSCHLNIDTMTPQLDYRPQECAFRPSGIVAAMYEFDIDATTAEMIFMPDSYSTCEGEWFTFEGGITADLVAKRVRGILTGEDLCTVCERTMIDGTTREDEKQAPSETAASGSAR